ncbi:alpha/beta hydrolase [Sphingomonas sp. BK580]|uniref:alpha/beta hydrolase n=1 Tax=Sphingomonas sp. BK580 TaxID=2586972 RepID=UPI00161CC838|nr:alpha/beta hydrolase [Sphingomonas sp. BK580]MBB3693563.1 acetyl esterase/lipase [Sphingomonas sp. BK580]
MRTINLVDPASRELAVAFAAFDPSRQTLEDYRNALDAAIAAAAHAQVAPPAMIETVRRDGSDAAIRLLVYAPEDAGRPRPAILFLHASGFIAGRPESSARSNHALAVDHGAVVVAVEYGLAPESCFPGPLEDCYAALRWLTENAGRLRVDPSRIVVMGESAGGGLAAALAQLVRDRGELRLAGQILVYPMLDPRTGTEEAPHANPIAGEFVWTSRHNRFGWDAMRGTAEIAPARLGHLAPALAADVAGLPPTFIAVGALDLFVDEDAEYALRLARAGVSVELHIYPAAIHGFDLTEAVATPQYRQDLDRALRRMLEAPKQGQEQGVRVDAGTTAGLVPLAPCAPPSQGLVR